MRELAVIFDFGNVVGFFDYLRACDRLGAGIGLSGDAIRSRLLEQGFAELLIRFESGLITPEEFAREITTRAGLNLSYREFVEAWQDIFWLNEPVARLIESLDEAGYTLVLGSNTNVLHATHYRRQFASVLDRFDHLILSHEVGHMKPDARFYAACESAARRPAGSCIFVDDLLENVEAARRAGLIGLHYVSTPDLTADLGRLGIDVGGGG